MLAIAARAPGQQRADYSCEVAFRSLILDASSTPSGSPSAWRRLRRATDANAVSGAQLTCRTTRSSELR